MNSNGFRKELTKIMPGYSWTVHRNLSSDAKYLYATGIQSSGFNRLSTLSVKRWERDGIAEYEATSSGYGKSAPWLSTYSDATLARVLRGLQDHYEIMASNYGRHAKNLQTGRA